MIVTLAEVKAVLKPNTDDDDALITTLISRKQKSAEGYIGYPLDAADYSEEKYDGTGKHYLYAMKMPINTVTKLNIVSFDGQSSEEITSSYYKIHSKEGMIYSLYELTKGIQNIELTYNAGYADGAAPEDLKDAIIQLVCAEYVFSQIMVEEIISSKSIEKKRELEKDAYVILSRYKIVKI